MSKNKTRTYVILDGLQESQWGQALSRRWMDAGLPNGVDVAGQFAWITPSAQSKHHSLDEENATRAANIAQLFGLEIRDEVTFVVAKRRWDDVVSADNNLIVTTRPNEGDLICDFFAGSGTTAAVAEKLKRKWIFLLKNHYQIL